MDECEILEPQSQHLREMPLRRSSSLSARRGVRPIVSSNQAERERERELESEAHRYSNMSCTPTNRHALAKRRNPRPVCAPTQLRISRHSHTTDRARGFLSLEREREGEGGAPAQSPSMTLHSAVAPSTPTTKPTRLAVIMRRTLKTPPSAARWRYQGREPNCVGGGGGEGGQRAARQGTETERGAEERASCERP